MIRKGDTVKIKQEWQDAGDDEITFVAVADEDGGRVLIQAQIGLTYNPTQTVHTYMLETE